MTSQLLKVGDVAKRTGVSIRTLHYYDEKGLLKPSHRSEAGYRLYTLEDLMQLQKIKSLQQLGMSLDEILALNNDKEPSVLTIINAHIDFLNQQIERQSKVASRLQCVAKRLADSKTPTSEMLIDALQETVMYEKYFSEQQLETLESRKTHYDPDYFKQIEKEWADIFKQFQILLNESADPASKEAQTLAAHAQKLIHGFTGGETKMQQSLEKMYDIEGGAKMLSQYGIDVDEKVFDFYIRAMKIMSEKEN